VFAAEHKQAGWRLRAYQGYRQHGCCGRNDLAGAPIELWQEVRKIAEIQATQGRGFVARCALLLILRVSQLCNVRHFAA